MYRIYYTSVLYSIQSVYYLSVCLCLCVYCMYCVYSVYCMSVSLCVLCVLCVLYVYVHVSVYVLCVQCTVRTYVLYVLCVLYVLYVYIVIMCTSRSIHSTTIHTVLCCAVFYRLGVSYFDVVYADIDRQVSEGPVCNSRSMLHSKEFTSLVLRSAVGEFRYPRVSVL